MKSEPTALLEIKDLVVQYETREGPVRAVDGVSLTLSRGESLGLVGESASGKTSLAMAVMKLLPDNARIVEGRIILDGQDLVPLDEARMRRVRWRKVSMVFQAAMSSLNPVYKVGDQIEETILAHERMGRAEVRERTEYLFRLVGLDISLLGRYPHEYSGGMKQRAVIAMALACGPDLVIADEPTTALDVIVQHMILRELQAVRKRADMAMIFISHDMAVVAEVCDRVGIMYAGKLVERGETAGVFQRPMHRYTQGLLSAVPSVAGRRKEPVSLPGDPPNLLDPPSGCRFHPRCAHALPQCKTGGVPQLVHRGKQWAICWNPVEPIAVQDGGPGERPGSRSE